ncbi:glycosyltransferase [Cellulomonas sp. NPDC057328]|uniref:glycosyltransferase n=1 Tax=Cellulomonas sp. NPDC057328 TaxID=3346101 RepID=UPI0036284DF7
MSTTARVLHVTECLGGGVPKAMVAVASNATSYEHHVLWPSGNDAPDGVYASVHVLPAGTWSRVRALRDVLLTLRPDLVHAHSSWAGVLARVVRGAPVVYQPHAFAFEAPTMARPTRALALAVERALAPATAAYAVLSEDEGRQAARLSRRVPRHVVPNVPSIPVGVAPAATSAQPSPRVAMAGRVGPQKDPTFFAAVARLSQQRGLPYEFVWIGGGGATDVGRLREAGVRVTGWLDEDALARELGRCGVYLHSAAYEGFPLSVLDALAAGLPVVARRIPALAGTPVPQVVDAAEALDAVHGLMTDPAARQRAMRTRHDVLSEMNPLRQRVAVQGMYQKVVAA